MSLVALKNLFYGKTITPLPRPRSNTSWTNASEPLLSPTDRSPRPPESFKHGDLESQHPISSQPSKPKSKGFRIDARVISDATIGLSDGLTVPFALTAGLSALGNTKFVIYGGFAELIAGAISMGVGGYLGAKSESASYKAQKEEVQLLVATDPHAVTTTLTQIFVPYNIPSRPLSEITASLSQSPHLVDFIMKFSHCLEEPASSRAFTSAATIALAYFLGGLLPLIPYFFVGVDQVYRGLYISIGVMVTALFAFGYGKTCAVVGWEGRRNVREGCWGGVQMVFVGSVAAGAAMGLVRGFSREDGV
ncbi:vacuolar iron transporter Ccc1 [Glarea lozoyensis ATCC 20868]|uniref:Vacuolar iron transporter Ccc1 n=1 Tax=Glarea lozoyensis (strain ATCC 20868 / MF5171) TaxID=1116229 RepID=S3D372_GLAL2|nr:vacuolar iron transporter Ccc1 [Glarea lozoyensis ATCC 20868]EPE31614.1 vacuolar iron transporter Ccc1 [Glarea lozoyensis ATCC 20868]